MNRSALLALWAATIVAGFGVGRWTSAPPLDAPPEDMAAAIRASLAEGDALERLGRTTRQLEHLDPENLPEVLAVYERMLPILDQWDIRPFVAAWARFDPAAAFDHTLAWRFDIKRKIAAEAAMHGWALRDPLAARVALDQAAPDHRDIEEGLFFNLLSGWVSSGQEGIEEYINDLPPMRRTRATAKVVGALMRTRGAEATLAWADSVLREASYVDEFKKSAFRNGARSVARGDPERAAAWVLGHAGHEYANDGPRVVAEEWARQDGRVAMQWVRDQTEGVPRDQAARAAFVQWLRSDPEAARQWLFSEDPLTAFHDPAIDVYARLRDARAPEEAIAWCERILDSERRLGCLQAAATEWYRTEAVAAETWLQQSPLSEEARRAVRTPPTRRKRARPPARAPQIEDWDEAVEADEANEEF